MKIRALVQSSQWLDRAGVRIRYRRISPHLERQGARIIVDEIDNLEARWLIDEDVVIFSKCTDARALYAADYLRERGIMVGVDMFDDYFSPGISPCHRHREFLREMASRVDFFLCSTERMRGVAADFAPDKPCHVLNDPFDTLDQPMLASRLEEKAARARADRRIDVLWFGNGNNPVFPVGLTDLAAYAGALQPFARAGYDVRLKVLTNLSALHSENLARLRAVGLPMAVEEWSQDGEARGMEEALISFLPVNHQNFSIAKSLNRGISALTGGTQILSAGFDLYETIGPFRYRDANDLLVDLDQGSLRLRPDTLPALKECMNDLADPANEAGRLLEFLKGLPPVSPSRGSNGTTGPSPAIIHGNRTPYAVIAFAQDRGIALIGTPFCAASPKFNLHFDFRDGVGPIELRMSKQGANMIAPSMKPLVREDANSEGPYPFILALPADDADSEALRTLRPDMVKSRAGQMVHYARVMGSIERIARRLFRDSRIYRSELEAPLMGMTHLDRRAAQGGGAALQ
ncbi:hypothetical protein [Porphyrobacter sp. AAP60]|uniref:hypothetical protein n=1 Tax=Porphyrobacter sp. AAP60 TaxID=1523423 RepID=UPI0006B8EE03|nr:hypothetical protein [Porphyrobacter sp. AAP60]KPF63740.1 hypothetical protein IP79_07700 [Porphyrobacter sp. AAP60]